MKSGKKVSKAHVSVKTFADVTTTERAIAEGFDKVTGNVGHGRTFDQELSTTILDRRAFADPVDGMCRHLDSDEDRRYRLQASDEQTLEGDIKKALLSDRP